MAGSRRSQPPPPRDSRYFAPDEAARAMDRLHRRLSELKALNLTEPNYVSKAEIALDNARSTVSDVFGEHSDESSAFWAALIQVDSEITLSPFDDRYDREAQDRDRAAVRVQEATERLDSLMGIIHEKTVTKGVSSFATAAPPLSRRVFLVHGRNEEIKQAVARVLERLKLEPIILHEQPDRNRTIIEKFEEQGADVGFAVILMTGDDRGGPKEASPERYQVRARQNVLLEMGFFLGRLTRMRVCVLYESGVEMPSDYSGVLYKKLDDAGGWKLELAREIKAAGIDIDFNLLA